VYRLNQSKVFKLNLARTRLAWLAQVYRPEFDMKASSVGEYADLGTFLTVERNI